MEPEPKRRRFSQLPAKETASNGRKRFSKYKKSNQKALVTFLAYYNKVKPEEMLVKNTELLENILKKKLKELEVYLVIKT